MSRLIEKSLWQDTVSGSFSAPSLDQAISADVAIIGGGYTGLSAALHLAEAGVKTCVLEARQVGFGGSGRNVGFVNAGLWSPPIEVEGLLGETAGRKLNSLLDKGPDLVFDLIEKHQITCDARRQGTLHCAVGRRGFRELESRYDQRRARGAPVELLTRDETASRTGTSHYSGSLFDPRAGTIQPKSYVTGLAKAARNAGALLFENTPAISVSRSGGAWQVKTPNGVVRCGALIQAANAYASHGVSNNSYTPVSFFQAATRPLPGDLRDQILAGGEGCWDTATVMTSLRVDGWGRLIIGGVGNLQGLGGGSHRAWARRKLRRLYPALPDIKFDYAWTGRIAMSRDHLPKILKLGDQAISIFGYSGRGIAPGTVFGKAAATWVQSGIDADLPVPLQSSAADPFAAAKARYFQTGATLFHMIDARQAPSQ